MDTSKERLYKDRIWLCNQYVFRQKSIKQICREYGWGYNTIKRWLRKYEIQIRQIGNKVISRQQGLVHRINKDKLAYGHLHVVMRGKVPSFGKCNKCFKETEYLDCANISGEYKDDISDWEWLCRSCHVISDGRAKKMLAGRSYHGHK